jgi:hypothetical protein
VGRGERHLHGRLAAYRAAATHGQAQRFVGRARKLRPLPQTRAAWEAGRLSTAQVDAILARVSPKRLPAYMDCEADLVTQLARLDGQDTIDVMAAWANLIDDLLGDDPATLDDQPDTTSELWASRTLEGRTEVAGSLEADLGMIVRAALRAATTTDGPEDPVRSPAQKRADALGDICKFFLDHHDHPNPTPKNRPKNRPHVGVVLDYEDLLHRGQGTLIDSGEPISAEVIQQLLCDAAVHRILRKGSSTILDLGRTTPVVSPAQHAALAVRDGGCRWPGCDRPPSWCDAHHIDHWGADFGPTALANLALLCRRHHRRIHRRGTFARLDLATAQLTITLPSGRVISSEPRVRATTNAPPT